MKTTYTATFSTGTVLTRSSERQYVCAYMVTVDGGAVVIDKGFSTSKEAAKKAASALISPKHSFGGAGSKAYKNRGPVIEIVEAESKL